jgi:hypothetical protein
LLLVAIGYATPRQIIGRHFNAYAIAHQDSNPVLPHLAGDDSQDHVISVLELHFEKCVRLLVDNGAFSRNQIVFSQSVSP